MPQSSENPNVIMVDDSSVILSDRVAVLEEVMPDATITGFIWPKEAIDYVRMNRVVFLTAYADYSLDAWKIEASGFILKPLTPAIALS